MDILLQHRVFKKSEANQKRLEMLALAFLPVTTLSLFLDSVYFTEHFFEARMLTNLLVCSFLVMIFFHANARLRILIFIMPFLSFVGEVLLCKGFGMYEYRLCDIPFYVPFGHAVIYSSGYLYASTRWAARNKDKMKIILPIFITTALLLTIVIFNDIFSLILLPLILLVLRRKKWDPLYCYIGICVFVGEITGAYLKCWTWSPEIFGISSGNPPLGALLFYVCGDLMLAKIADRWQKKIR